MSNPILEQAAKSIATRYNIPMQDVINCCPTDLVNQTRGYGVQRISVVEMEQMVDEWGDAVRDIAKRRFAQSSDAKRLKYFRRKYGPHITMEHLPRAAK